MTDYKLVPVEPTPEMVAAGARHLQIMSLPEREAASVFRTMCADAPVVQVKPAIRKLGIMGAAFDPPSVRRAYTYSDQPNNTTASKLGSAAYKERSGGDLIDYGLQMLRYLQDEGFGVFEIDDADPAPQPVKQKPAPDVDVLVDVLEQVIKAAPSSGPLWHGSEQIVEAREALAAHRKGNET